MDEIFNNNDILHRIMLMLGPRHVCIGVGATCHQLRDAAKSDTLWKEFWLRRCSGISDVKNENASLAAAAPDEDSEPDVCHDAAKMFHKSFKDMGLNGTTENSNTSSPANKSFFAAYVQAHWLMKSTNLRINNKNETQQIFCTQEWPRSLCDRSDINRFNHDHASQTVTCLNPAEVWCDHPSCSEARCGKQGCLRCYRFMPRDYSLSANGSITGQCSDRSYDMMTFVKCCWCCVSFCNRHVESYFRRGGGASEECWYHCDVCQLSSCPDCISQIFARVPNLKGCSVVTNGRVCGRRLCDDCVWRVGTLQKSSEVLAHQGQFDPGKGECWAAVEECCPTCVGRVCKRMEEMQSMQQSFMGFMP